MLTTIKKAFSFMVNADRVKKKIPSLLVDGDTSKRKNYNAFFRERYRLQKLKKRRTVLKFEVNLLIFETKEKGKFGFSLVWVYGRLRNVSISTAPIMMITIIIATAEAKTYVSVIDACGVAVGVGVAAGDETANAVSEYDGQ